MIRMALSGHAGRSDGMLATRAVHQFPTKLAYPEVLKRVVSRGSTPGEFHNFSLGFG